MTFQFPPGKRGRPRKTVNAKRVAWPALRTVASGGEALQIAQQRTLTATREGHCAQWQTGVNSLRRFDAPFGVWHVRVAGMAPTETQFENLKKRVRDLEDRTRAQTTPENWSWTKTLRKWWPIILALLCGLGYVSHLMIDRQIRAADTPIETKLGTISDKLNEIKGELDVLLPRLAQESLGESWQAVKRGDTPAASQALSSATAFLKAARAQHIPVEPHYFAQVTQQVQALASTSQLSSGVHNMRLQLAAYRSSLRPLPAPTHLTATVHRGVTPSAVAKGTELRKAAPGPFFGTPSQGLGGGVEDLTLVGAVKGVTQDLDHTRWINITFVNVHIIYHGGPVELRNVRFVNCTFDFPDDQRGVQFSEYVVLSRSTLKIPRSG